MWRKCSPSDLHVIQDYAFVTNCLPEITPSEFRRKHTKEFLQMLHPHIDINDSDIKCMDHTVSPMFFQKLEVHFQENFNLRITGVQIR